MSDSLQPHGLQHARLPCLHYLPDSDLLKSTSIDWANDTIWPSHPLQYFGHLMQRANSLEKVLMLGKIGGKRRSGWQRVRKMLSSELGTVAQSCLTLCNPSLYAWTAACQASLSITNPRVYSNSCPLSQWCHPTISSSVVPFSSRGVSASASGL